ncbi:aromatase/cyclase [Streptomyces sp. NPDC006458]|uniref:aromatase/cyclase n=1 Tax=Streptomyces sp. NPDC006458 TaxID=3154302 RepID=UPI0033AAAFF4
MSGEIAGGVTRNVHVAAPAGVVYALMADTSKWPLYFSPNVHVERLEFDGQHERIRVWALMDGQLRSWVSARRLDQVERRIEFRQELPESSLREMLGGAMSVRSQGPRDTTLELGIDITTFDDPDADRAQARLAAERSIRTQLRELKSVAEQWTRLDELTLTFEDSMRIKGAPELVYDFLYRADAWPGLVPYVARVDLTEEAPGVQRIAMEAVTEYGTHNTESIRICFPHAGRIICKQTVNPALLAAHTTEWSVAPDETGVTVTVRHSVVLREEDIAAVLGEGAGLADARRQVREMLGRNSLTLLTLAKEHAETAVRML